MPSLGTLNACRADIQTELDELLPLLEGLRDLDRLNILPLTRRSVEGLIGDYERRQARLEASLRELDALVDDKYPGLPSRELPPDQLADVSENVRTVTLGSKKFVAGTDAVTGTVDVSNPRPIS